MEFNVHCVTPPGDAIVAPAVPDKAFCGTTSKHYSTRKILLTMKLIVLFTLIACLQASSRGHAQAITLSLKNAPLEKVFTEVRKQSRYRFIYAKEDLAGSRPVNIEVSSATIEQVLEISFREQPFSYSVVENHVIIKRKKDVPPRDSVMVVPPITVKGRILNERGEAIEGVSVKIKGTSRGTSSNADGMFELKDVGENAVLVFSGVNVENYEVMITGKTDLSVVSLKTRVSKLDEVQLIGYGTSTQRYNVGSVTKVTAEEISKQPVSNPLLALQARVPGLTVSSTSGLPGGAIKIQVRGQKTLSSTSNPLVPPFDNPLFIIDGVPTAIQNSNVNQFLSLVAPYNNGAYNNLYGGYSPFSSLNPSDIESIEVLRDADATAIYGSRGANGVILITTKKGNIGKARLNLNVYRGLSFMPRTMPMMNTEQYKEMRREAFSNDGLTPNNTPGSSGYAPDLFVFDTSKYSDWSNYFFGGTANTTNVNTSLSGGNSTTQFLIGAGFRREKFIFPGDFSINAGSVNTNISHKSPNKKFALSFSNNYSYNQNNSSGAPEFLRVSQLEPNHPDLSDNNGKLIWNYNGFDIDGSFTFNPLAYLKKEYKVAVNNLISNLQLSYNLLPQLIIKSDFGYNTLGSEEYSASPLSSYNPNAGVPSSANFGTMRANGWIVEPQVEYSRNKAKSKLTVLVGTSLQRNTHASTQVSGSGYQSDALLRSISGASTTTASDANSEYRYNAVFGRLNYVLNRKYILNLSGRRDGSSRFGREKQFGNFGAVGAGWVFSEEPYIKKNVSFISYGKIRTSYGATGSDAIGDYMYVPRWGSAGYSYQGTVGYIPLNLNNPDFSWGVTKKFELGLELGFFEDRVLSSLSYYKERSGNQLIANPLPTQVGFSNVIENWQALVQNSGMEFSLSAGIIKTNKINWNASFNISIPRNKLMSFPGIENSPYNRLYIVGEPLSVLNKFVFLGVNDTTGIFQFETNQKTATYTPATYTDYHVIGNLDPKYFGGLGSSLAFKGFALSVFVEFKKQLGINYLGQIYGGALPGTKYNQPAALLSRWQKPGDEARIQKFTTQYSSPAAQAATYFTSSSGIYSDASYIRCKTASLSYSVNKKHLTRLKIEDLNIYLAAQNLFTISDYLGNDPETQTIFGIPTLRTVVAGLKLTF